MGREMVRLFAADGANVVAVDLNANRLEKLRREYPDVTTVGADISSAAGADTAIAAAGSGSTSCVTTPGSAMAPHCSTRRRRRRTTVCWR